jgi:hypothetical protein
VIGRSSIALPSMPPIGQPEGYYARVIHQAEKRGDQHSREAGKVGQYITLGLDPNLEWEQKLRYFQHALRRHCVPPPLAREEVWVFYGELADLVRRHAGNEMLRLASREDDLWARRVKLGQSFPRRPHSSTASSAAPPSARTISTRKTGISYE